MVSGLLTKEHPDFGRVAVRPEEIRFLRGPQRRDIELLRAIRIFWEFIRDPDDTRRFVVTDSPEAAAASVRRAAMARFGLTYGPKARRRWFLGE